MQTFSSAQEYHIKNGEAQLNVLYKNIEDSITNNVFKDNFITSSKPGWGKSHSLNKILKAFYGENFHEKDIILISGNPTFPSFFIDMTTAVYKAEGRRLTVILDDCDMLFQKDLCNITKKMFDESRVLSYSKSWRAWKHMLTPIQEEAFTYFSNDDKAGITVPVDNVTFIILTNRYFPTENDVAKLDQSTPKYRMETDLLAIRRRVQYKRLEMSDMDLWGYIANITLTSDICEKIKPDITQAEKVQILSWCHSNWKNVTERNLSIVTKLTKEMVRFPNNYIDIWEKDFIEIAKNKK